MVMNHLSFPIFFILLITPPALDLEEKVEGQCIEDYLHSIIVLLHIQVKQLNIKIRV